MAQTKRKKAAPKPKRNVKKLSAKSERFLQRRLKQLKEEGFGENKRNTYERMFRECM